MAEYGEGSPLSTRRETLTDALLKMGVILGAVGTAYGLSKASGEQQAEEAEQKALQQRAETMDIGNPPDFSKLTSFPVNVEGNQQLGKYDLMALDAVANHLEKSASPTLNDQTFKQLYEEKGLQLSWNIPSSMREGTVASGILNHPKRYPVLATGGQYEHEETIKPGSPVSWRFELNIKDPAKNREEVWGTTTVKERQGSSFAYIPLKTIENGQAQTFVQSTPAPKQK